jgi:hypothetical protein
MRLPTGSEFSPAQVGLGRLLEIAHSGRRGDATEAIRREFFADAAAAQPDPDVRLRTQQSRANNALLGMAGYGLLRLDPFSLTELGERLRVMPDAERRDELARHILMGLNGRVVLDAVRGLQARREKVTKLSLVRELSSRGLLTQQGMPLPENTTDHLVLLKWLREAGVLPAKGYEIDEAVFARLTGLEASGHKGIAGLSRAQRLFLAVLKEMAHVHGTNPIPAKRVKDQCGLRHPGLIKADRLRGTVLAPLEAAGWVTLPNPPAGGRGGKSGLVAASEKLLSLDPAFLAEGHGGEIPAEVRDKLETPLDEVMRSLQSQDTGEKGLALEVLAVRLAYELGLTPVRFRERGVDTQGAEVDLIAEGLHLHYSRWLFQCKNTQVVRLSALAKEVGLAVLMHAHVIVLVTTGRFAETVREHAEGLARTTAMQAVLIDGAALERYRESGIDTLIQQMRRGAASAKRLKRGQELSGPRRDTLFPDAD